MKEKDNWITVYLIKKLNIKFSRFFSSICSRYIYQKVPYEIMAYSHRFYDTSDDQNPFTEFIKKNQKNY